jgi:hypothetical protein
MQERGPGRRLRFVRPLEPVELPSPREQETAESILPGAPRVGALDALLREVDTLRLTLETDLTLAAAAVEAGGSDTAIEIIEDDLDSLHAFETSAIGHLADLAAGPGARAPEGRWAAWARVSAAPFVAAAAVIGLLLGVLPQVSGGSGTGAITSVSAQSSLEQLTTLAAQGRTNEVRVAALTLHDQISALVDQSSSPATAQQALLLLSRERSVIVLSGDGAALHDVLVESAALAAKIRSALPLSLRSKLPVAPAVLPASSPQPKRESSRPKPTASPTPSPRATTSPKPTTSASPSAKPSGTPSATASSTPSESSDPTMPFLPSSGGEQTPPPGASH